MSTRFCMSVWCCVAVFWVNHCVLQCVAKTHMWRLSTKTTYTYEHTILCVCVTVCCSMLSVLQCVARTHMCRISTHTHDQKNIYTHTRAHHSKRKNRATCPWAHQRNLHIQTAIQTCFHVSYFLAPAPPSLLPALHQGSPPPLPFPPHLHPPHCHPRHPTTDPTTRIVENSFCRYKERTWVAERNNGVYVGKHIWVLTFYILVYTRLFLMK